MMHQSLQEIVSWLKTVAPNADMHSDARQLRAGDIFVAVKTATGDGRLYIQQAIERGAGAILYEAQNFSIPLDINLPALGVEQLLAQVGEIAHLFYQNPAHDWFTVAVTGTNGKTSCSQWIAAALSSEQPCAVIGTLGTGVWKSHRLDGLKETGYTTPDATGLQRVLSQLNKQGARALAIEASSIGIVEGRLQGLHIDCAVLTNLTRDHLDFHGTMEAYAAAKAALFDRAELKCAVLNFDDPFSSAILTKLLARGIKVLGYGLQTKLSAIEGSVEFLQAQAIRSHASGTQFTLIWGAQQIHVKTKVVGQFNVSNLLAVASVLLSHGWSLEKVASALEKLNPVNGRMEVLGLPNTAMVVVDYAHTPDALEKALQTLLPVARERQGELCVVFGCGGDRDPGKRPQMGAIAALADRIIVTSDNPRFEDPDKIIADILAGIPTTHARQQIIVDRAHAILNAIKHAGAHDVILIAGKGHENYQDVKGKKSPFSDQEHATLALNSWVTSSTSKRGHA